MRISPQNNSKAVTNEAENVGIGRKIPKERYIASAKRQNIIN